MAEIFLIVLVCFSGMAPVLVEEPEEKVIPKDLEVPPLQIMSKNEREGVKLAVWSARESYRVDEFKRVWVVAEKKGMPMITLGVGGSLFESAFLYVNRSGTTSRKVPIGGGIDGPIDAAVHAGCISSGLSGLPAGSYEVFWKAKGYESNHLEIILTPGK